LHARTFLIASAAAHRLAQRGRRSSSSSLYAVSLSGIYNVGERRLDCSADPRTTYSYKWTFAATTVVLKKASSIFFGKDKIEIPRPAEMIYVAVEPSASWTPLRPRRTQSPHQSAPQPHRPADAVRLPYVEATPPQQRIYAVGAAVAPRKSGSRRRPDEHVSRVGVNANCHARTYSEVSFITTYPGITPHFG